MSLAMGPEVREALTGLVGRWRDQVATYRDDLPGWTARAGVERCARELEDRLSAIPDGAWRAAPAARAEPDEAEDAGESDADPATSGATSVLRCCAMRAIETASHFRAMHESTAYYVLEGAVLGHSEDGHLPWPAADPETAVGAGRPRGDGGLS